MLLLAFLGLIVTDVRANGGWDYWKWAVPGYALLALWLSWYLKRQKGALQPARLGHELLHWGGLIGSVFLVSAFIHLGIIGRFEAGLFVLTLLAQAIFLAGIYIEATFLIVGLCLGGLATIVAFTAEYLYAFAIPLLILAAAAMFWLLSRSHKTP